ncbi:uncharacterized protein FA14DRAFT_159612 [Meira miltonrushii]|uniref:EF-hand n=1 Tax=Meira miltonrushii TaxID=1280837 RepID=A0A316VNI2_9BASI|nr:uncharacterized protein FA14DRAFT_159612 [Meira miltonrushii]PWN37671.1 hypothetical protein FA14DRAFT_159612 [Meira miltonrushii]
MSASTIQLTPGERGAYGHFFALADPQSTGVVSGNSAVSFFALSGLPSPVLGSIWTFADKDNNGFLTPADFSTALRLIGHAQSGKVVTEDLIQQPGPLPTFKGITLPPHLAAPGISTPNRSSSTIQPQATGGAFGSQPGSATEIRPDDRARYTRIFAGAGPQHGLLDGEKAKEIFVKSKLPFDKLGAIWTLADTKARGKLDLTDFIIGMHFIQSTMNGSLSSIPTTLPAGLYEKAAGSGLTGLPPSSPLAAQNTGGSASGGLGGPGGYISRQMTGSQFGAPGSPSPSTIRSPPPSLQPQRTGTALFNAPSTIRPNLTGNANWSVTPADKTKADQFFDGLDQDRKGVLEGQAAVPFFMQSGLDEATLAHVWDLSDITQSGSLTRDEFAVAMHLINLKLTGSELPQELPANLIPPSLRGQSLPQAVNPQETDTQKDLFSLMDDDIDLPVSTASAFAKPAIAPPAAAAPASATTASRGAFDSAFDDDFGGSPSATTGFTSPKPAPSSVAGALSPVPTGTSASGIRSAQPFGDASADAANQRLALESTQKSLTGLETTKADLTKSNAADAHSIEDLRTRLETVRMRHQTESESVKALQERQKAQSAELKRLREESVHEESELSRLKAEKDEIEQALMKDREDVREMKSVVAERTKAKEALKAEIEKLKKEARQQKGLVAIGKKQLSQADSDLSKAQDELNAAREEGNVQEHAAHGEVPVVSPQVNPSREAALSPAASIRSNNPFDRFSPSTAPAQSHTGAFAVGGAAGAVAAGVGAAALSHHDQNEKEGTSTADDPFGLTKAAPKQDEAIAAPHSNDATAAFDDAFGENIPSSTAPATDSLDAPAGAHANVNQSFDDAFADLDQPATSDPTAPEATSEAIPGSFGAAATTAIEEPIDHSTIDAEEGKAGIASTKALDEPEHVPAPSADEVAANADVDPGFPSLAKGKQVARDADEDSSDDDDDGPEDFEGHGKHFVGSPDEVGDGKEPFGNDDVTAKQPATAENAVQAANRFPEVESEETTGKAPLAPSVVLGNATPTYTANATPLAPSVSGTSVNDDAFHDAATEQPSSESAVPNHERFTTAIDNAESRDNPAQLNADQRAISPAKTRRAPPAVPLRSGTATSTPQGISNAGPFGASSDQLAAVNSAAANPMDDFDAAFEDLGPTTSGNAPNGDVGNVTSTSGFDDTFGEADGFDFVPSFSTNNFDNAVNNQSKAATTLPGSTNGGAFDGFDSTFENAFETGGTGQKALNAQSTAPAGQTNSNTGSGFSFDDAFVPAEAISTGQTPPQQSTDLPSAITSAAPPPTLPARNAAPPKDSAGALPDDAGPVKQLCSMGFTRPDVIKALEKSNYRTDKALERLLAQA